MDTVRVQWEYKRGTVRAQQGYSGGTVRVQDGYSEGRATEILKFKSVRSIDDVIDVIQT